jgi:solute carrier family 35 protein C2
LSVAGIVKEILTILLAVLLVPGDSLTLLNILGLLVSLSGIAYYNYVKLG